MPAIRDPMAVVGRRGTIYPPPHDQGFEGRVKRALTGLLGLTQFGVNLTTLEPGAMSAQRHWHTSEDECVTVIEGEITLVTDEGETLLGPGMVAGFPKGERNGHHLVNRSAAPAHYLEIGTRSPHDDVEYPDLDLKGEKRDGSYRFLAKDGTALT